MRRPTMAMTAERTRSVSGQSIQKGSSSSSSFLSLPACLPFVALIGVRRCNIGTSAVILSLPFPFLSYCTSLSLSLLCLKLCVCAYRLCPSYSYTQTVLSVFLLLLRRRYLCFYIRSFVLSSFLSFFILSLRSLILIIVSFPRFVLT